METSLMFAMRISEQSLKGSLKTKPNIISTISQLLFDENVTMFVSKLCYLKDFLSKIFFNG